MNHFLLDQLKTKQRLPLVTLLMVAWLLLVPQQASAEDYYFSIGETAVTSDNISSFPGLSFDFRGGLLTMDNVTLTGGISIDPMVYANMGFRIQLTGENSITPSGTAVLRSSTQTASVRVTFSGTGTLKMTADPDYGLTEGIELEYADGLQMFENSTQTSLIAIIAKAYAYAPNYESYFNYERGWMVELFPHSDGEMVRYSYRSVDGTADIAEIDYSEAIVLTKPGMLTAYAQAMSEDGTVAATSESITLYYFGVTPNPLTVTLGETPSPTLVPSVSGVGISSFYGPGSFATYDSGKWLITGVGEGTATVNLSLPDYDQRTFVAINDTAQFVMQVLPPAPVINAENVSYVGDEITLSLPESLSNAGEVTVYYSWNAGDSGISYNTGDAIPAENGTLYAWTKVNDAQGNSFWSEKASAVISVTKNLANAEAEMSETSAVYTGSAITPSFTVYEYSAAAGPRAIDASNYTVSYRKVGADAVDEIVDAGQYMITITGTGDTWGGELTVASNFEVTQAPNSITTRPEAVADLTFNGEAQTLVTAGEASFGTLVYSLSENGEFTEELPTATAADTYTVYFKVEETDNYAGVAVSSIEVKIAKATPTLAFDKEGVEAPVNGQLELPVLTNEQKLPVTYSSSNENVAMVNAETGAVTVYATGETTITAKFAGNDQYNEASASYKLVLTAYAYNLRINGTQVTDANRKTLFEGTVTFDGQATLALNNANLTSIESGLLALTISLIGDNAVKSEGDNALLDLTQGQQTLNIICDETQSCSLYLLSKTTAVSGFSEITIKEPLDFLYPEGEKQLNKQGLNEVKLGAAMIPIVLTPDEEKQIRYTDGTPEATTPLVNTTINNVLYTLHDTQTPGNSDDGYADGMVVLNSEMTPEQVDAAAKLVPGTQEYAEAYKGLTFMVPAGWGQITLDAFTDETHALLLKIGGQDAIVINTQGQRRQYVYNYACATASYVRIYNGGLFYPEHFAPSHRIGPKPTVSTGVGGLSVKANTVDTPPATQPDYRQLSKGDIEWPAGGRGHIVVSNKLFTDLADDAFDGFTAESSEAPRRSPADLDITYIDLRGTSITGKEYDRLAGAFKGVPENTFIYLPGGNVVNGKNMVVGTVCAEMELAAEGDKAFELAADFTANKATVRRAFQAEQRQPICLPFDLANAEDYGTFFVYGGVTDGTVLMNKTTEVKANTAYYLEPKSTLTELTAQNATVKKGTLPTATGLVGTFDKLTGATGYYYDNATKTFLQLDGSKVVNPFEAYLNYTATGSLNTKWEGDPEPDGISTLRIPQQHTADWYTLDGRKLNGQPAQKGLYIYQGKKVVVK